MFQHQKFLLSVGLALTVVFTGYSMTQASATETVPTAEVSDETKGTVKETEIKGTKKAQLSDAVTGLKDLAVEKDAKDIDWIKNIKFDKKLIKEVKVDASGVDLSKVGEYKIIYRLVSADKKYPDESIEIKVSVVAKEDAQKLADSGKEVLQTEGAIKKNSKGEEVREPETQKAASNNPVSNTESPRTDSNSHSVNTSGNSSVNNHHQSNSNNADLNVPSTQTPSMQTPSTQAPSYQEPSTQVPAKPEHEKPIWQQNGNGSGPNTNSKPETEAPRQPVWHDPVYEDRYVVDQEAWDEVVSEPVYDMVEQHVCAECGVISGDPNMHLLESGHSNWWSEWISVQVGTNEYTIHHDEVGHWESVLVQEGYWE